MLPAYRAEADAETADELDEYDLDVVLDPATGTIAGTAAIRYRNSSGVPQREVYFRLFPNADYYGEGSLTVSDLTVDGAPATSELSATDTVLRVPLPTTVAPGDATDIGLTFVTVVPTDSQGSFGILSRSSFTGTWTVSDWYPSLAGYEPDRGWRIDPPTSFGDPTFAESARYNVSIAAPADLTLVTTGVSASEADDTAAGVRRFIAGPAREFTFAADDDFVAVQGMSGDTVVTSYVNPGEEAAGQTALEVAVTALDLYGGWFGPYPFAELDIVSSPLAGALGVSWAGLIQLDGPGMLGVLAPSDPVRFASIVAHEVGHQWWGGLVGINSNDHTFLLEGLTNYVSILWIEATSGRGAALGAMQESLAAPYIALLQTSGDQIADLPIAEDQVARGTINYAKASLGFFAIHEAMGDKAFDAALATVVAEFRFGIAEPVDVRAAFAAATNADVETLWQFWFKSAATTPDDVEALFS